MAATPRPRRRVLIVDDDRALRHVLATLLTAAGHTVEQAADGPEALARLDGGAVDIVLLDIGLPGANGLDILAQARARPSPPVVVMMTADDTPDSLIAAVRGQAFRYLRKPFPPSTIADVIDEATAGSAAMAIEVISARPEWVELVAPCTLEMTDRIQSFVMQLDARLPEAAREEVAQAFRELLNNAIEWGGKLDPDRKVRISCVRAKRLLLYRIADPGEGFDPEKLNHAAIANPPDSPLQHAIVREEQGIRPGGLGLMMTQSLVDELIYNEARNEVMFIKYLD
jgi:CheY-like chemotaxis protein/anti-sigma regulatory factor (Ser/Thr protein kinase)